MAEAQAERVTLRRPKGLTATLISRLTASPKTRAMISKALRKPIFARDIWISGKDGEFIHFSLEGTSKFDKHGYRTKQMGERGTLGILGSPKGTWDDVRGKSRVALRLQGIRVPKDRVLAVAKKTYGKSVRYTPNPLLMTVMNPGYGKNPVDVEYDAKSKGYRVFRTNSGKKSPRRRGYARNPAIPLWNNPEFGALPVNNNPLDIATAVMPIYNDNPCKGVSYCNNPGHGHENPLNQDEVKRLQEREWLNRDSSKITEVYGRDRESAMHLGRAEEDEFISQNFAENPAPGALPGYYGAVFNENPTNPLNESERSEILESANEQKLIAEGLPHLSYRRGLHGGKEWGLRSVAAAYNNNPSGMSVGDFVRNLKRVTRGQDVELESGQVGRIISVGQFMGDTVYTVQFLTHNSMEKTFKFFPHELKQESSQLGFEDNRRRRSSRSRKYRRNRYAPAHPKALQRFQRPHKGMPKYGELSHLAKQPNSRPGTGSTKGATKSKMPIAKFEEYLARSGSPDEKRRYAQAKAAYRRFHKGADPEFISRKVVDVGAGKKIIGKSFAYSMGKSPFEPYITPKGSGKGNNQPYLHEYETMPEGLTVPAGKVVIKPLDGRAKITDWIHH